MKTVESVAALRAARESMPSPFGLVPTMGFLHEGHLSLVRRARQECASVGVSIFVNPTQFTPGEDFERYSRNFEEDYEKAQAASAEVIFAPSVKAMYPPDTQIPTPPLPKVAREPGLEESSRPGHFEGVCQVVARLFDLLKPRCAVFGEKDYQQLLVIRAMVEHEGERWEGIEIISHETVRESDGLALSSRNVNLSSADREAVKVLHRSLLAAKRSWDAGERSGDALRASMTEVLDREPLATTEYASIADFDTFQELDHAIAPARALVAVNIGTTSRTRLIDNVVLG